MEVIETSSPRPSFFLSKVRSLYQVYPIVRKRANCSRVFAVSTFFVVIRDFPLFFKDFFLKKPLQLSRDRRAGTGYVSLVFWLLMTWVLWTFTVVSQESRMCHKILWSPWLETFASETVWVTVSRPQFPLLVKSQFPSLISVYLFKGVYCTPDRNHTLGTWWGIPIVTGPAQMLSSCHSKDDSEKELYCKPAKTLWDRSPNGVSQSEASGLLSILIRGNHA